ncbi:hypothetical protein QYM36_006148 [Artemia franciscana]|uniref:CSC1-like protein 2 n=2 Tax=Artemia franciscana TaxID=6661 RepID=A0AA88I638_ARTSF|nr:hypothetical protein QYM36_006148 [Artemia franciscana]
MTSKASANSTTFITGMISDNSCGALLSKRTLILFNQGYQGIPENTMINVITWMALILLFCWLRTKFKSFYMCADIRPIENETDTFGLNSTQSTASSIGSMETSQNSTSEDTWVSRLVKSLSWIGSTINLSENDILSRCGEDAINYLRFEKMLILYVLYYMGFGMVVIFPINSSGERHDRAQHPFAATTISNIEDKLIVSQIGLSILLSVIGFSLIRTLSNDIKLRRLEYRIANKLMVTNIPVDECNEETLKQHFREAYPRVSVEIDAPRNKVKVYELQSKIKRVEQAIQNVKEHNARMKEQMKLCPYKFGYLCYIVDYFNIFKKVDALTYYETKAADLTRRLSKEKERAKYKSLGMFFVKFERLDDAKKFKYDYTFGKYCNKKSKRELGISSKSKVLNSDNWKVSFAPLSKKNIYWENIKVSSTNRCLRQMVVHIILFLIFMFISTPQLVVIYLGHNWKDHLVNELAKLNPFLSESFRSLLSLGAAALLPSLIWLSDKFLNHWTHSEAHISLMIKTFVWLVFMVLLLPALGLLSINALVLGDILQIGDTFYKTSDFFQRVKCVFWSDNSAFFVNYIITASLIGTVMDLFRVGTLICYIWCLAYAKSKAEHSEVLKYIVGFDFDYGTQYAWILLKFCIIIFYGFSSPLITIPGFFFTVLKYYVDKYNVYYVYSESQVTKQVHYVAIYMMIASLVLTQLGFFALSFSRQGMNGVTEFSLIGLVLTTLYLCLVFFSKIFKRFGPIFYRNQSLEESEIVLARLENANQPCETEEITDTNGTSSVIDESSCSFVSDYDHEDYQSIVSDRDNVAKRSDCNCHCHSLDSIKSSLSN